MNCTICDHPLIDHGYDPESMCNCCSGRNWGSTDDKHILESKKYVSSEVQIPRGFVICEDFPDYMVNKQGTVKHVGTGKFCFLVRIANDGKALINLRKDGKSYIESAQNLRDQAFNRNV